VQPATGELMAERIGRPLDLHDLRDNIEAGIAYLDFLHGRYGSDTRALLAAYHQGPQSLRDHGIYRVSDRYADQILELREVFRSG
jgi:soluble lytic murein transglycosylase-like protein